MEKQHIINHFISDYNHNNFPNESISSIVGVGVLTGDVGNWDHTKQFFVEYKTNLSGSSSVVGIVTLYGSQNGYTFTQLDQLGYTVLNPFPGFTII